MLLSALLAGCATTADQELTQKANPPPILDQLQDQSYSAEELGIQWVGDPGSQTIRWQEIISPRRPVVLSLLENKGPSIQPRVAASLNGSPPLPVSIDSGAALNMFHAPAALAFGVKVADPNVFGNMFQGLGGQEYSYYGMADRVSAGALTIQNLFTVLRAQSSGLSVDVDNVLGLATLAKFSYVSINYPGREVVFALEGSYTPGTSVRAEAPLILESFQLMVDLQINDRYAVTVLVDTGNDASLMLTQEMVEALELAEAAKNGRKERFLGIGGAVEATTFQIESMSLGEEKFAAVEVTMVPNDFPPSLGSGFLQQFRATLDFKARKLWLEQ